MNEAVKKARARLDEVIQRGEQMWAKRERGEGPTYLDEAAYAQWRLDAKTNLRGLNPGGQFEQEFVFIDGQRNMRGPAACLEQQVGLLRSLRENFDEGYLLDLPGLVRAEVFADFIEQAEYLFQEGAWHVVPVVVGAVLE